MGEVRRREYAQFSGVRRRFIKGQRYNRLSRWENLTFKGKQTLKLLFRVDRRLNKAYLLKESFGQLWEYNRPCRRRLVATDSRSRFSRRTEAAHAAPCIS
jgi:transposase